MPSPTRLRRAADEDVVGRIWRKDGTLWAPEGTPEVTNRLGWLDIAERSSASSSPTTTRSPRACAAEGYRDAVVLGMGGSSLAPEVFRQSFGKLDDGPDAARAGLDAPAAGPRGPRTASTSTDALDDRLVASRAGRSSRCRCSRPSTRARATARTSSPSPTRARALEELAHQHGFRAASSTATRTSAAATARCQRVRARPGRGGGYRRRRRAGLRDRRRRGVPRRAAATPACGSAARSASSPARAATSSRSSPTPR